MFSYPPVKKVSVVIPVYNEQESLPELIRRTDTACATLGRQYEILLVDDGSSDDSARMLTEAAEAEGSHVVAVLLNRNYGQHSAIMAGFSHVTGDLIITLDADLQNPPEEIPRLVEKADEGYDVVGTVRQNRQDTFFRKSASKMINRLIEPTSGKIYIDGRDLWADPEKIRDFRFLTGLVFQYPEYQLFEETCYKDIAFGPRNMGLDEAEIDRRVHEAADFVGLDEALLQRSPFELSGGQKRRVAVAGVMAMKPRILVLDEPAAGLDPEGRDEILSEVKEYHKKTGTTVLLVSHSMEDIAKYADRVLVMSNKKIAMYDTVENVFARAPELLALGLSVPQVTKIFLKLREMGVDVPADVYTVPYAVKMILEAKKRRDAGESLVLPRVDAKKGGAATC